MSNTPPVVVVKTEPERIAVLEAHVDIINNKVDSIEEKLDTLLALKHKGMGAFWLSSTLVGTGIVGTIAYIIDYLKGIH